MLTQTTDLFLYFINPLFSKKKGKTFKKKKKSAFGDMTATFIAFYSFIEGLLFIFR